MSNLIIVIDKFDFQLEQVVDLSENQPEPVPKLIEAIGHVNDPELYLAIAMKIDAHYFKNSPLWVNMKICDAVLALRRLSPYGDSDSEKRMIATSRQHIVLELAELIVECLKFCDKDVVLSRVYINRVANASKQTR